jgi:segregation and condensation protein B
VTSDGRPESLAEQAAAWVPPWKRSPATDSPTPPDNPEPQPRDTAEPQPPRDPEPGPRGAVEPGSGGAEPGPSGGAEPALPVSADSASPGDSGGASGVPAREVPGESGPTPSDVRAEERPGESGGASTEAAEPAPAADQAGRRAGNLALIDDAELRGALEAILLVVDQPVTEIVLAQVLEQPTERIAGMLERLARDYTEAGHGFELRRAAGGWRLYTRPEYAAYVERFVLDGQSVRLTQAALETLAVVAYKQPVTRSRISAIRGVNCDGVIRTLVSRGLVEECGTEPETGAHLYRTTTLFLEKLGLDSVDQLPPLAPFLPDNVEEITDAPR